MDIGHIYVDRNDKLLYRVVSRLMNGDMKVVTQNGKITRKLLEEFAFDEFLGRCPAEVRELHGELFDYELSALQKVGGA